MLCCCSAHQTTPLRTELSRPEQTDQPNLRFPAGPPSPFSPSPLRHRTSTFFFFVSVLFSLIHVHLRKKTLFFHGPWIRSVSSPASSFFPVVCSPAGSFLSRETELIKETTAKQHIAIRPFLALPPASSSTSTTTSSSPL